MASDPKNPTNLLHLALVISPKIAVCLIYNDLEIPCVALVQHCLISFLLTKSHCMVHCFPYPVSALEIVIN